MGDRFLCDRCCTRLLSTRSLNHAILARSASRMGIQSFESKCFVLLLVPHGDLRAKHDWQPETSATLHAREQENFRGKTYQTRFMSILHTDVTTEAKSLNACSEQRSKMMLLSRKGTANHGIVFTKRLNLAQGGWGQQQSSLLFCNL